MSKYVIRAPFAVHLAKAQTTTQAGGGLIKQINTVSHFHDENKTPIELSDKEAVDHMHKLEPADDAAKKLFGDINAAQHAARTAHVEDSVIGLEERIAAAVAKAMAAAGRTK